MAATAVVAYSGLHSVLDAVTHAGIVGIVLTSLFHFVPLLASTIGWQMLFTKGSRPSLPFLLRVMWIRASVNNMMPVARVGGEVVAVRLMTKHKLSSSQAIATTVVELTLSVLAVFLFVIAGVTLLILEVSDSNLSLKLAAAMLATLPMLAAMVIVQRVGFFGLLDKIFRLMFRQHWQKLAGTAARLDRTVHIIYRRKRRVLWGFVWQFVAWASGAAEVWLALYFLGHEIPLRQAIMLEALIQATASLAFAIPGALGAQEASILFFGQLLGLPKEVSAALAILRRCRDILIFVPGLIVWQVQEGRWLLKSSKKP